MLRVDTMVVESEVDVEVDTMVVESESRHMRSEYLRLIPWWWRVKVVT